MFKLYLTEAIDSVGIQQQYKRFLADTARMSSMRTPKLYAKQRYILVPSGSRSYWYEWTRRNFANLMANQSLVKTA